MHIIVNSAFLSGFYSEEYINFFGKTFEIITRDHPEHNFVFLCENENKNLFSLGKNAEVHVINHPVINPVLWKYWYDVRVPALLRKYQADLFITTSGFCSLTTKVPQCMMVPDLPFLHFPSFFTTTQRLFYKKYTKRFAGKAKRIIALSAFSARDLLKNYQIDGNKIDTIYNGINEIFKPANDTIKYEIKAKYTEGKDFFLYSGIIHPSKNLVNLLKAFSLFKKRQQSNLKLLLCGKTGPVFNAFEKSLHTYKYRADVVYLPDMIESERAMITASAYALVHTPYFDGFSTAVMEAMQCNVPVITTADSPMQEITANAALYADPANHSAIAEQLMRVYKDENLRNELIKKGETVASRYDWNTAAGLLWLTIRKTVL